MFRHFATEASMHLGPHHFPNRTYTLGPNNIRLIPLAYLSRNRLVGPLFHWNTIIPIHCIQASFDRPYGLHRHLNHGPCYLHLPNLAHILLSASIAFNLEKAAQSSTQSYTRGKSDLPTPRRPTPCVAMPSSGPIVFWLQP